MFEDTGLENYTWTPNWGNGIGSPGSPNPTSFTGTQPTPLCPWLTATTVGAAYADGLLAMNRPLLPSTTNKWAFTYVYDTMTSPSALISAQAFETTIRIFGPSGWNYPGDFQINYEEGGMVQIWQSAANPWANTGIIVPKFIPMTSNHVEMDFTFDDTAHVMSLPEFRVNGVVYTVPASMQNVAGAKDLNWPAGRLYLQNQLDLNSKGGSFSMYYKAIKIVYPQS